MREATRRQVFGIGAGAIGVLAAPGSVAAVADSRPNDARLMELHARWREVIRQRRVLIDRIEAIQATFPEHLQPSAVAPTVKHMRERAQAGAPEAELNKIRTKMQRHVDAREAVRAETEIPDLEDRNERLSEQARELEIRMAAIAPDTAAGADVLADVIEREAAAVESIETALESTPHAKMAESLVALVRRQAAGRA